MSEILKMFDPTLEVELVLPTAGVQFDPESKDFIGKEVALAIKLHSTDVPQYHHVLNEARLSAIALAIYLASVLRTPKPDLCLLVLDDVLIGLDMEYRLPVLEVLQQLFSSYQVLLLTYDPIWFDAVAQRVGDSWKKLRLRHPLNTYLEVPVIEGQNLLQMAQLHASNGDLKAAAVYARSAFEVCLQRFCEKEKIPVRFHRQLKRLDSDDFLKGILSWQQTSREVIGAQLETDIKAVRSVVLNPLSHASAVALTRREVEHAIDVVAKLEAALK